MKRQLFLVLNNVRSAYNVGSMLRTADAAGVSKVYLCGYTPTPSNKTALGAESTVPWEQHAQAWRLLKKLKEQQVHIVALEQYKRSKNLFGYTPRFPLAIVVGHERQGLSSAILQYTDDILEIPMHGSKESLNVAVAAGIALYTLINVK